MTLRRVEVLVPAEYERTLLKAMDKLGVSHTWHVSPTPKSVVYHFVTDARDVQRIVDVAQTLIDHSDETRVTVLPVELALPAEATGRTAPAFEGPRKGSASLTREELRAKLRLGAVLDRDYLLMVALSTVVAVIGLVGDNVAVLVGAMVIAPFLGPNLALAFATTMGDRDMLKDALRSLGVGLALVIAGAAILGFVWADLPDTEEMNARTIFGLEALVLAIASGGAAVLALTGAAPMTLVGVMVAVALLPPATVVGLKLGAGDFVHAQGAFLLLLVNIIGLNISAKAVFTWKGISPRRWEEKGAARRSRTLTIILWLLLLLLVAASTFSPTPR